MKSKVVRLVVLAVMLAAVALVIIYRDRLDGVALERWVNQAGAAGPWLFMLIYAAGTVLFLPGSVLTLAGGALFGPAWGTLYNLSGATLGAALAFLLARYLAGPWVERRTGGRLQQLRQGVDEEGWRFVAFVRLVPLFPFNLLNYALGLTRIRFWHYVVASYVCMLPGALAYTYLGYAGREAVTGGEGMIEKGLLALALLAVVAFVPRFIQRLRRGPSMDVAQLHARLEAGTDLRILDVRTAAEFAGHDGRIRGACNIPVEQLAGRLNELTAYRQDLVAVICHSERRSWQAARLLAQAGFGRVHVVRGGMQAWRAAGYAVQGEAL